MRGTEPYLICSSDLQPQFVHDGDEQLKKKKIMEQLAQGRWKSEWGNSFNKLCHEKFIKAIGVNVMG